MYMIRIGQHGLHACEMLNGPKLGLDAESNLAKAPVAA